MIEPPEDLQRSRAVGAAARCRAPLRPARGNTLQTGTALPPTPELQPLCNVPSIDFGPRVHDLDLSVLVIAYRAGKLVDLQRRGEGTLNTRFRPFPRPLGLAVDDGRLATGTVEIREVHTLPAGARAARQPRRLLPSPLHARHR